jgi:hypothetical protein
MNSLTIDRNSLGMLQIEVPTPFEAVGAFLTIDVRGVASIQRLLDGLLDVVNGNCDTFEGTYNIFSLEGDSKKISVVEDENLAPGNPRECLVPTSLLYDIASQWLQAWEQDNPKSPEV